MADWLKVQAVLLWLSIIWGTLWVMRGALLVCIAVLEAWVWFWGGVMKKRRLSKNIEDRRGEGFARSVLRQAGEIPWMVRNTLMGVDPSGGRRIDTGRMHLDRRRRRSGRGG